MAAVNGVKPLRWARLWLGLWSLAIVVLVVVCLIPLDGMPPLPENSDKIEHLAGYFILAGAAVQLFRGRTLVLAALGLVLLGIGVFWRVVRRRRAEAAPVPAPRERRREIEQLLEKD